MNALLFPGQGSQVVGMGSEFYNNFKMVKEIFKEADANIVAVAQRVKDRVFGTPAQQAFVEAMHKKKKARLQRAVWARLTVVNWPSTRSSTPTVPFLSATPTAWPSGETAA